MRAPTRKIIDRLLPFLNNCPIEASDFKAADDIYGPNLGALKGKTVYRPNPHVDTRTHPVPADLLSIHKRVTLEIDIMFVNKMAFFVTHSQNIHFITIDTLDNRQVTTIKKCLDDTIKIYHKRGFEVTSILSDNEFTPLKPEFPSLNPCAAGEHIPGMERTIRTIKDSICSTYCMLPFSSHGVS